MIQWNRAGNGNHVLDDDRVRVVGPPALVSQTFDVLVYVVAELGCGALYYQPFNWIVGLAS